MKTRYIDVHCHLNEAIFDNDRKKILTECLKRGILVIDCGGTKESNRKVLELTKHYPNIKAAVGVCPTAAVDLTDKDFYAELKFIESNKQRIVAIGEVGADKYWFKQEQELVKQFERFSEIIWFANKNRLPLNVHSRSAESEIVAMLSRMAHVPVILHCFGGDINLAKLGAANGFYFSIPPIILRSKKHQRIVEELPLQNLLTETDSPYLGPTQERNDPRNIPLVIEKIAELKNLDIEDVRVQILKNAGNVFMLT